MIQGAGEFVNYTYDSLNRLATAWGQLQGTGRPQWSDTYAYDGFGTLLSITPTGSAPSLTSGGICCRGNGYVDLNGYLTNSTVLSLSITYDMENRPT